MPKRPPTKAEREYMGRVGQKIVYTFNNAKDRCNNPNNDHYVAYGARGIKVEWQSVAEFRQDMLPKLLDAIRRYPGERLSIDRIDNDGNYSADNCQWLPIGINASKDNRGKPKTEAHRAAMSRERKGKPQTRARADALKRTHEKIKKAVIGQQKSTGDEVFYTGIMDAARALGIVAQNIQEICAGTNPRRKTAGGYYWRYAEESND